ncbi:hypothetical protein N0V83_009600 [Neocucurbitaria cava]|uniref:Uncharacterized protein n=1 Tax=Neocucurbitaria cava TaxID=798079 RepID=A0A9W9CIM0_9PLEO|nr:hypothetical protein N0V83_009600 [Neocucurbitaria cava]
MSDLKKPVGMIGDKPKSSSTQPGPENNRKAASLASAVPVADTPQPSHTTATDNTRFRIPHAVSELQPDEPSYTGTTRSHYMASIVDSGNHRLRTYHWPKAPDYNQAFQPIGFMIDPVLQSKDRYAGVPEAHNMHPMQAPLQSIKPVGDAPARRESSMRDRIDNMVLPDMALPDKSNLRLSFTGLNEAKNAVLNQSLNWMPPAPDDTIPKSDVQRASYVLRLLLAMRNRENVLDKDAASKRYNATGEEDMGGGYYYRLEDMEKVCWEIVHIAEALHSHGPKVLSIYDRVTLHYIKKDMNLTFEERMEYLIKMLCFFKSRCDVFMKGSGLEEIVAQPFQKLSQALSNRGQNDRRAEYLAAGRKAKGKVVGVTATPDLADDNDNEPGAEQMSVEPPETEESTQQHTQNLDQGSSHRNLEGQGNGDADDDSLMTNADELFIKPELLDETEEAELELDARIKAKFKKIAALGATVRTI